MTRQLRKKQLKGEGASRSGAAASLVIEPLAPTPWWARWALAAMVAAAAVLVYWNTLSNEFVTWDDADYVCENPLLSGSLRSIWGELLEEKKHEQYYPLVFTSYWIEHQFVGFSPWLYHATQIGLHAANAAFLFFVLRWLGVGLVPSGLAAALFAVHPINVASVAWVTERKNTLSGLFFFIALLLYLQYRRLGGPWRYGCSLAAFLLALFAKTAVVILPMLLVVSDRVLDRRWTAASVKRAVAYLAIGFFMAMITIGVEREQSKSGHPLAPALRPLVASAALVHYIGTILWPAHLLPMYPRWPESFGEVRYWLSAAAVIAAAALLIRFRMRLGDLALFGVALFLIPLLPALGLVHFNLMQYTFVSDHLAYLAAPGIFLAAGLLIEWVLRRKPKPDSPAPRKDFALAAVMIFLATAVLGGLTMRQNRVWHDGVSLWEYTLAGNPDCVSGHLNLGNQFRRTQQDEKALAQYREAMRLLPDHINSARSCAQCCRAMNRTDDAIAYYQEAMRRAERKNPRFTAVHLEYAGYLRKLGRLAEARAAYEAVLAKDPKDRTARAALERMGRK